jgi:4-amino-4-deoxy-L-arabinose transferase-like glycosyltransferase
MKRGHWRSFVSQTGAVRTATAGANRLEQPGTRIATGVAASSDFWRRLMSFAVTWPGGALLGLTVFGLALRVWGLWWGAPDRVNLHPDEMNHVVEHAERVLARVSAVARGQTSFTFQTLDPGFLNYPSFLMYLIVGISGALRALGLIGDGVWQLYLVGRAVSAIFGAATVAMVFLIARELGASRAAVALAALWMALMPLHVWESHIAVTDVMMTFWISVTLLASLRVLRTGSERAFLLAGISLGLAAGSKYTALLAVVPIVMAAWLSGRGIGSSIRGLMLAAAAAFLFCLLVTPYSFLRFPDTLSAIQYEYQHTHGFQPGFSMPAVGPQYYKYLYQVVAAWPFSLGFALYASVVAGVTWSIFARDRRLAILLSFAAVFFAVTGSWRFTPLRYYLPILVVGVLCAALWQGAWLASAAGWRRATARVIILVTLAYTGLFTLQTTARFKNDTRIQAGNWIGQHIQGDSRLMMIGSRSYVGLPPDEERYDIDFIDHSMITRATRDRRVDIIEITSLMYARAYRHHLRPHRRVYEQLRTRRRLVARFESHFINKALYVALDPMFEGYFVSPTIELYAPREIVEGDSGAAP